MNRTSSIVLFLALMFAATVTAQAQRPAPHKKAGAPATSRQISTPKPNDAAAAPAPTPSPAATSTSPVIAIVNDATFTAADIEPTVTQLISNDPDLYLRDFYQDRAKAIREARQRAVDARINSMLIAAEASKRKMTMDAFLDAEINSKIANPTEAEVRTVFDQNRAQLGDDFDGARTTIINYLRNERVEKGRNELVNRLKMTNTVQRGADVNSANLAAGTVLASVNGQPLRIETINERMKAYVYKMDRRIYDTQMQVLDRLINYTLIVAEETKKNIGA